MVEVYEQVKWGYEASKGTIVKPKEVNSNVNGTIVERHLEKIEPKDI